MEDFHTVLQTVGSWNKPTKSLDGLLEKLGTVSSYDIYTGDAVQSASIEEPQNLLSRHHSHAHTYNSRG